MWMEGLLQRWDFLPSSQTHWGQNCSHPFLPYSIQLIPKATTFDSEAKKLRKAPCKKTGKKKPKWFFPLHREVSFGDPACLRHCTQKRRRCLRLPEKCSVFFVWNKSSAKKKIFPYSALFSTRWPIWREGIEELITHLFDLRGDMIPSTIHSRVRTLKKEKDLRQDRKKKYT